MMKNKTITILIEKDSWLRGYAEELRKTLKQLGHHVSLIDDVKKIKESDVNFLLGVTQILSSEQLQKSKHNMVVHESDLPDGAGFAPMSWQILDGKNNIPFCLFEADFGIDSGPIWLRDVVKLKGTELANEWRKIQAEKTIELCLKFIKDYEMLRPKLQEKKVHSKTYKRRGPKDSELSINKSIKEQFNLLRVVDNERYPAFFFINKKKYKIAIYEEKENA